MNKVMTVSEAIGMIKDGATICTGGFIGNMHPEALTAYIENSFLESGKPKNLTLVYAAGQGDGKDAGVNHLGHEGIVSKVIGGHWGLAPKIQKLALENKVEAYNLPQGVITHLFRDIAAGKPGTLTHVGLNTFVDPRLQGGKLNERTTEDLVKLIEIEGKEYLLYKAFPIDYALVRATYADTDGNATFEKECVSLECLAMCQAAKNSGGKVILQVERVVQKGTLDARLVRLPGIYVDAIVIAKPEQHMQTFGGQYNPSYSGEIKIPVDTIAPLPMSERKIVVRRAAMELVPYAITNLGIGMPEGVSLIASEEGLSDKMLLTIESGPIGGVPAGGLDFGATTNPDCIISSTEQFDFYDGGGLDIAFLGLAQVDREGNVNVSKFGPKIAGCGGFINITQTAKKLVYCGTFTAGGLKVEVDDGKLRIINEGKTLKFINEIEQITFSGSYAISKKQPVLFVTERAVFELTRDGLKLTEIAPGVDLEKDILALMEFKPIISKELRLMDERIFRHEKMGL